MGSRVFELLLVWGTILAVRSVLADVRAEAMDMIGGLAIAVDVANRQTAAVLFASVIGLVAHEAAHALVASVIRAPILDVRIGIGPVLLRFGRLRVRLFPVGGQVSITPPAAAIRRSSWRGWRPMLSWRSRRGG